MASCRFTQWLVVKCVGVRFMLIICPVAWVSSKSGTGSRFKRLRLQGFIQLCCIHVRLGFCLGQVVSSDAPTLTSSWAGLLSGKHEGGNHKSETLDPLKLREFVFVAFAQ